VGGTSESVGATEVQASTGAQRAWRPPDERRALQLVLATIWLFDGILQLQPFMFTRQFGATMLAPTAHGNPNTVAHSITWASQFISNHSVATDASFATIQILLGLGIAWRPSVKAALAASIVWSCAVWWFGEGLGGVIAGTAHAVSGAPGAVLIYAVLAVLLWPSDRGGPDAAFIAARAVGERAARIVWVLLWGGLSIVALLGSNRSATGLRDVVRHLGDAEPRWLSALDQHVANVLGHRGLAVSIALAVVLGIIAVSVYLPARPARAMVAVAVAASLAIWVLGENFGAVLSGSSTDPNSGPILALVALAYWRRLPQAKRTPHPRRELSLEGT
jgi:hypothetical protein